LATAREYLNATVQHTRDAKDQLSISFRLLNLAECLGWLGEVEAGQQAAAEAATHASATDNPESVFLAAAYQGWLAMLAGDSRAAEEHFLAADRLAYANDNYHLNSLWGGWWGEFLVRTGRPDSARQLIDRNREFSTEEGWNDDVARCDRVLASLDLAAGDHTTAISRATAAAATFRDGDYLVELAATLPVLAEGARAAGDLGTAAQHVTEALTITGPRALLPFHAAALVVRAHTCTNQATAGSREHLARGRDAADAALRIAARHGLAWQELDTLDAHVHLDQAEGVHHGWAKRAAALRARLLPAGLDPDPMATVEGQVAEEQARREQDDNE
jgi:hypothetical protein